MLEVFNKTGTDINVVTDMTSLKYDDIISDGSFELWVPITDKNLAMLQENYLINLDNNCGGIIQLVKKQTQKDGSKLLYTKGRMLDGLLDSRIVWKLIEYYDYPENIVAGIVDTQCVRPETFYVGEGRKNIGLLSISAYTVNSVDKIRKQITGDNVSAYLRTLASASGFSYDVRLNYAVTPPAISFNIIHGEDRSDGNTDGNDPVVFTLQNGSVSSTEFQRSVQSVKNVALVAGAGEGEDRWYVRVSLLVGDETSYEVQELFVDARDIQLVDENQVPYTEAQYIELLTQRGYEKLAAYGKQVSFKVDVQETGAFIYGTDYNKGDIITVMDEDLGVQANVVVQGKRYEYNGATNELTEKILLGDVLPSLIKVITSAVAGQIAAPTIAHGIDGSPGVGPHIGVNGNWWLDTYDTGVSAVGNSPVGVMFDWPGATAPVGHFLCDGALKSRTTYADLFDIFGETYGAGDGSTTFALPNAKGKVTVGFDSTITEFNALGKTGGNLTIGLILANLPSHSHGVGTLAGSAVEAGAHTHTVSASGTSGNQSAGHTHTITTGNNSAGHTHSGTTGDSDNTSHEHNIPSSPTLLTSLLGRNTNATTGTGYQLCYGANSGTHDHGNTDTATASHVHPFTTGGVSASHTHSGTTSGVSANHTHSLSVSGSAASAGAHTHTVTISGSTASVGSGTQFEVLQPYIVVNKIIKYTKSNIVTVLCNIDCGTPGSVYGGIDALDCGGVVQGDGGATLVSSEVRTGEIIVDDVWNSYTFDQPFIHGVPKVTFTPYTSATSIISPKYRNATKTGFEAVIGGSGFTDIPVHYIAVFER